MRRTAVLTAAVAVTVGATSAAAAPLERHRPVLVYDEDERFFARSVDEPERPVVYGHVAEGRRTWLQYWLYFAYNAQDRGILKTGRHEGDWELLQLRLDDRGQPELVTLGQHSWAAGCTWNEMRRQADAPVVYVANGSHALYPRARTWDRPFPDPNDEADGEGTRVRPPVYEIDDGRPAWVERRERWGKSRARWVPGEQSSPLGPKFQESRAWEDPAGFHADRARSCLAGPPGRAWQTPTLLGGLLILGVLVAGRRRFIQSRR